MKRNGLASVGGLTFSSAVKESQSAYAASEEFLGCGLFREVPGQRERPVQILPNTGQVITDGAKARSVLRSKLLPRPLMKRSISPPDVSSYAYTKAIYRSCGC
jgi:hypothetical protein